MGLGRASSLPPPPRHHSHWTPPIRVCDKCRFQESMKNKKKYGTFFGSLITTDLASNEEATVQIDPLPSPSLKTSVVQSCEGNCNYWFGWRIFHHVLKQSIPPSRPNLSPKKVFFFGKNGPVQFCTNPTSEQVRPN